jgi:tetratricopeptide (TPR) repeat protein
VFICGSKCVFGVEIEIMSDCATEEGKVAAIVRGTRWARWAVLGVVCALVVGIYEWKAEPGLFELSGSGAQDSYYNLLVRGFRDGRLNVKRDPPPGIAQPGAAADLGWSDCVAAGVADLSYYKGKLYLYFGVTPALALFWPYVALTGHYLPDKDAGVIFFSVGFLAGAGLLWSVWRRYFRETGVGVVVAGTLALGLANLAPAVLGRCDVYEVAISCGYAMTMLALAGVWAALHEPQRRGLWLAAASLAYGLALGARPSLLFGAVILLVPVARAWREKRPVRLLLLAACGPIVAIGAGLMLYNALRFGNPLEFGETYQLPINPHHLFSPRYIWYNFRLGFLDPAIWSGVFPFVHSIKPPAQPPGYWNVDAPFGVLTNVPVVWMALAAPLAWRRASGESRSILRWFLAAAALLFGMCALTLCCHDSMCLRYETEYASPLVLLAVVGFLALERALVGQPVLRRAARCGWGLLLAFSLAFNWFASFDLQAQLHCGLGVALEKKGRVDEAIRQYHTALQLEPSYAEPHYNEGNALFKMGRVDEAIPQYQKALQLKPDFTEAHNSLGDALAQSGRLDEAVAQYQQAVRIDPEYVEAHYNLGNLLQQAGRVDDAIAHFQKALQINPGFVPAYNNLAVALRRKGRVEEAITQYQKALQLKPDQLYVLDNLAWLLATTPDASLRDGAKAAALAARASQLSGGGDSKALCALAAAYAEEGSCGLAASTARRALELAIGQKNSALAAELQKEIQLYEADKPVRDGTTEGSAPTGRDGTTEGGAPTGRDGTTKGSAPTVRVLPP